jgi:hypothetical protein
MNRVMIQDADGYVIELSMRRDNIVLSSGLATLVLSPQEAKVLADFILSAYNAR